MLPHSFVSIYLTCLKDILGDSGLKNLPANTADANCIPGSGRCPGGGDGNPLQYPCLRNPMDREAWRATVHGFAKSLMNLTMANLFKLSSFALTSNYINFLQRILENSPE